MKSAENGPRSMRRTRDGVTIRMAAKTKPLMQWKVGRELRRRVKAAFDAEGIEIPSAQRMVWERADGNEAASVETR